MNPALRPAWAVYAETTLSGLTLTEAIRRDDVSIPKTDRYFLRTAAKNLNKGLTIIGAVEVLK